MQDQEKNTEEGLESPIKSFTLTLSYAAFLFKVSFFVYLNLF
jgi:hypothetical protein